MKGAVLATLVCCTFAEAAEPLPAFPGAEGFGANARGGRGGRVIKVTTLKRSGPGSLQEACAARGARIVVFAVSGVIRGNITIRHSNITIAGQTAPGAGITIEGRLHSEWQAIPNLEDVVIRFIRVRPLTRAGQRGRSRKDGRGRRRAMDLTPRSPARTARPLCPPLTRASRA